ncbi:MAG: hypothetical protein JW779_03225 [Candidatus Thorarchaeota archaeon]|nr:hypothetical protein [Candidatus Thorarchaeota archaeon]
MTEAILVIEEAWRAGISNDNDNVLRFIINQQLAYGSDEGVFIETRNVSGLKSRLYTGEKIQTQLAAKNILTLEAARALLLSKSRADYVSECIHRVDKWIQRQCFSEFCSTGECKHSTVSYMRYLSAKESQAKLAGLLSELVKHRDGNGSWKGFPYFYTLLALSDIHNPDAEKELEYAFPMMQKRFRRNQIEEPYWSRRNDIMNRIQTRLNHILSIFI